MSFYWFKRAFEAHLFLRGFLAALRANADTLEQIPDKEALVVQFPGLGSDLVWWRAHRSSRKLIESERPWNQDAWSPVSTCIN